MKEPLSSGSAPKLQTALAADAKHDQQKRGDRESYELIKGRSWELSLPQLYLVSGILKLTGHIETSKPNPSKDHVASYDARRSPSIHSHPRPAQPSADDSKRLAPVARIQINQRNGDTS